MSQTPKTIQIFLPGGDPQGIRVAEITTRIVQVIEVPRSLLSDFLHMQEASQVAMYLLFGHNDDNEPTVYIGQTGTVKARLADHQRKKDFWERAVVVISKTNSLTQTHALFLEWYCLNACRTAGRYADENGNSGSKPHTPAPLEADCLEIFDTARSLLATLGYPVFDSLSGESEQQEEPTLFYCKGSEADGTGFYSAQGFVVLKASSGRMDNVASMTPRFASFRAKLVSSGVVEERDGRYLYLKDHLFSSPSTAAMAIMGRTANGWFEWKDEDGRTLDEAVRQQDV